MAAFLSVRSTAHERQRANQRHAFAGIKSAVALCYLTLALCCTSTAEAAPRYDIVRLGFDDSVHTYSDGQRSSTLWKLSDTGYAMGTSQRLGINAAGQSGWLYNGVDTINIGLTGAEHTRSNNEKSTTPLALNEAGEVTGHSIRYNGGNKALGISAWFYDGATTVNVGLTGTEHSRLDGYRYSRPFALNELGQVAGHAERFNGTNSDLGQSVWLYDGTNTANVGLTGPEYTRLDGYKKSTALHLTEAGHVIGYADRYEGTSNYYGQSVWSYNGTTTIDIGLNGPEFSTTHGYRVSEFQEMNSAGQVVGHSNRYDGSSSVGRCAWLYDGTITNILGFTGAGYIRDDGYMNTSLGMSSGASPLNEAGHVVGRSFRYSGAVSLGPSAWVYNGASTIQVGLTGIEHTASDGFRASAPHMLNEAGDVAGVSLRYQGAVEAGQSAWFYNGMTTRDIGLTGTEHTRDDDAKFSLPSHMNETGHVVGLSSRYNGGSEHLGDSVWLYNGTATVDIGLTGAENTRDDGYKNSHAVDLNDAGQVAGYSYRYNGGSEDLGISAWFYDGTSTHQIGLTGDEHTNHLGYQYNYVTDLNQAGRVIGYSNIYNSAEESSQIGQEAWLYDAQLNQTFQLRPSTAEVGEGSSTIRYFDEDGLVMGTYYSSEDEEYRAFYFTVEDGLHDFGSLVAGGLAESGWSELAAAFQVNGLGQLAGNGTIPNEIGPEYSMPYLLTPIVSSPGDFNGDGSVDATDYTVWRDHLGSTFDLRGNGDETGMSAGIVDAADYEFWKAHFGATSGGGSNSPPESANKAVPEPSAYLPATLGAIGLLTRRRR